MKRHLLTGLFLLAALSPGFTQPARAQTEAQQHQQNKDHWQERATHAQGTAPDPHKSFTERYAPPEAISSFGPHIDWMFRYTSWTTFIFFVLMVSGLVYFLYVGRERPGRTAMYDHGHSGSSKVVTKLLDIAVFLSLDAVLIFNSLNDTKSYVWKYPSGDDVVKVMVMPQQWVWNFRYAGADGVFGTADDVITVNDMRVPMGKKVMVQMQSRDVIHGFMIPVVRMQMDAIPGNVTRLWFDTNRTGDFEIACYHMCGTAHYKMKAFLKVMEPQDYEDWVKEQSTWAAAKYDPEDKMSHWGWNWAL